MRPRTLGNTARPARGERRRHSPPSPRDATTARTACSAPHEITGGCVVRVLRPLARSVVAIRSDGTRLPLTHLAEGVWQGFAPGAGQAYTVQTSTRQRARVDRG